MKIGLETVVNEMPEEKIFAKDLAYLRPVIPEQIRDVFRFPDTIRRLRDENAAEILAERVAQKLLEKARLKPSDIDYLIVNNCGGRLTFPQVGGYLHHKLNLHEETPVLNVFNACASFVDACEVAWNLILAKKYQKIMIVVVSAWETSGGAGRIDLTDPLNAILGDGAGAAIVSAENLKCEFLSYYSRTWGEVHDWCACDLRPPVNPDLEGAPDQPAYSNYLYGTPMFFDWWQKVGHSFGIDGFNGALKRSGLSLSDLDQVIFHQPADMLYDMWIDGAEKAGLPKEKWIHTWDKYGNTANAVIPINLAEFWETGKLKRDSIQAWITIGAGGHAPTMITRWLV